MQQARRRVLAGLAKCALGAFVALVLIAFAAGSSAARSTVEHLSNATVTPRQATTEDLVVFTVMYTDRSGAAPRAVTVSIDGSSRAMTAISGAVQTGRTYGYQARLTVGKHDAVFAALDSTGAPENVGAGALWVRVSQGPDPGTGGDPTTPPATPPAVPNPTPTPPATPPAVPNPTPTPRATPPAGPDPTPPPATTPPRGVADPTPAPAEPPTGGDTPGAGDPLAPGAGGGDPLAPGAVTPPDGSAVVDPPAAGSPAPGLIPDGAMANMGGGGGGSGSGGQTPAAGNGGAKTRGGAHGDGYIPLGGADRSRLPILLAPTIATTTAAVVAWAAFISFGKRRRDESPTAPEEVLATAAAAPIDVPAATGIAAVDESLLPRWRRPSLMAARKTDPLRSMSQAQTLSFESAAIRPLDGYERRRIAYRLVRLLDGPDEVTASEIGLLDQGDEVQLVERCGAYWHVLCPDGRDGWIHRMTVRSEAVAPEPLHAAADPIDLQAAADVVDLDGSDILDVYLRARHSA